MVLRILRFEFLNRFKNPFTYLFVAMALFQGIWYSNGVYDMYSNAGTLRNAPVIMYQNHAGMGMLVFLISAIIAAVALTKDLDSRTAETIYSGLVKEKSFFAGRFLGAFLINTVLTTAFSLGMLLVPFTGIGTPDQFGPAPLGQVFHGFALLTIPNLFLITSVAVSFVVFFRKASAAYAGVLGLIMIFMMSELLWEESAYKSILLVIDPCGYTAVKNVINGMSVLGRNSEYLQFSNLLFWNRILWGTISVGLLIGAWFKFSFKYFITPKAKKVVVQKDVADVTQSRFDIKGFKKMFTRGALISKAFRLSFMEFKTVVRPFAFKMTMGFVYLIFLGYNFFWSEKYYLTTSHYPITSSMTFTRVPLMVYLVILVMVWAGELLFKDRKEGVWHIMDASPTPSWVLISARFIAMAGIGLLLSSMLFSAGLLTQITKGFTDIQWSLYGTDLLSSRFGWVMYLFLLGMAFFCGTLFNNRRSGHIFGVTIFVFILISAELKLIEEIHYLFSLIPGVEDYSEMNGYGVFDIGLGWYTITWLSLSGILILFTLLLWNRGINRSFGERLGVALKRFNWRYGLSLLLLIGIFGYSWNVVDYNVKELAGFQTKNQESAESSEYEKQLGKYSDDQRFKITDLKMDLQLFPSQRRCSYTAEMGLVNLGDKAVDTIHMSLKKFLKLKKVMYKEEVLKIADTNRELRYLIFKLPEEVGSGENISLNVSGEMNYEGFHQSDPQGDLTFNGSFLGSDLLPYLGYDEDRELEDNKERVKFGFEKLDSRMDGMDNLISRTDSVHSDQSDGLEWDFTISTDGDQKVVAPGRMEKFWSSKGRNYFHYLSDKKGYMDFKILSARYVTRDFKAGETPVTLYYDKKHYYNIDHLQKAVVKAMEWLTHKLGDYPYNSLSIAEKTRYDDEFYTFNNVITISEKNGWVADMRQEKGSEYIYRTVVRELAKQWITAKLKVANVQGADIYTDSIPEYLSLVFMEDTVVKGEAVKWLKQRVEDYIDGRGDEAIVEPVLLKSDGEDYIAKDKGGLAIYSVASQVGVQNFNSWLNQWIVNHSSEKWEGFLTSSDFYKNLKEFVPLEVRTSVEEWFAKRALYRISLKKAEFTEGKLNLLISSTGWFEEGLGEKEKNLRTLKLEVGIKDKTGIVRRVGVIDVKPGTSDYSLSVDKVDGDVILDPHYWYLDETREDNVKEINL